MPSAGGEKEDSFLQIWLRVRVCMCEHTHNYIHNLLRYTCMHESCRWLTGIVHALLSRCTWVIILAGSAHSHLIRTADN